MPLYINGTNDVISKREVYSKQGKSIESNFKYEKDSSSGDIYLSSPRSIVLDFNDENIEKNYTINLTIQAKEGAYTNSITYEITNNSSSYKQELLVDTTTTKINCQPFLDTEFKKITLSLKGGGVAYQSPPPGSCTVSYTITAPKTYNYTDTLKIEDAIIEKGTINNSTIESPTINTPTINRGTIEQVHFINGAGCYFQSWHLPQVPSSTTKTKEENTYTYNFGSYEMTWVTTADSALTLGELTGNSHIHLLISNNGASLEWINLSSTPKTFNTPNAVIYVCMVVIL